MRLPSAASHGGAWDNEYGIHAKEVFAMEPKPDESKGGEQPLSEPVQHITGAHQLLKGLSEKFGAIHPELNEAITKLELALSALTVNTGGMF